MAITSSRLPVAAASRISGVTTKRPMVRISATATIARPTARIEGEGKRHPLAAPEQADDDDDRHDHEILKQQHADAQPADRRGKTALLDHHLRGDGRRRQGQRHGDDHRPRHAADDPGGGDADEQHRQEDLRRADAEHRAPHRPQPVEREFEPDQEEQEDDAHLGEGAHMLGIGEGDHRQPGKGRAEMAKAAGPEDHAGDQEAQHRPEAQAAEQRHDHAGRRQHDHQFPDPLAFAHDRTGIADFRPADEPRPLRRRLR